MRKLLLLFLVFLIFTQHTSAEVIRTNDSSGWANTSYSNFAYDRNTGYLILPDNVTEGLVLYQKMSGSSGITSYDMNLTSDNNGTLTNMSIGLDNGSSGWNSSGKYGNAVSFDGVNDSVAIENSTVLGTNPKTFLAWVKPTLVDNNWHVIYKEGTYSFSNMFAIAISADNKYAVSQHGQVISGNVAQVDVLIHIRVEYNGTIYKIYENGVETGSGNMTTNVIADVNYFGRDDVGVYWKGIIDSARKYTRVLSNDEANQTMNNTMVTSANVTHWHDAGAGYQGSQFKFIFNNDSNSFLEGWVSADNSTWYQVTDNVTNDTLMNIPTAHKNQTQYTRAVQKGNGTSTPELIESVITTEVSAGSVDINVTYWNPDSGGLVATINVTNITAGVQNIYFLLNDTNSGWLYTVTYSNGTYVDSATATYENESLNFSIPLVEDSYNITESSAVNTSTIIIPANSWGMVNNWTVITNFSNIAANESNDVCYTYYNVTTGEWESYYPPYSWNANYVITLEASVMVFVNAETTITAYTVTPANTNLFTGWNMLFVEGTDNESVSSIIADIGANCTDVWWFNSTAGAYSNTTTDTVQPCQGFLGYVTQDFTWTRSDL